MTIRGVDPELVKQPPSGCVRCRRSWPTASFNAFNDAIARGEAPEYICDLCLEFAPDEIAFDPAERSRLEEFAKGKFCGKCGYGYPQTTFKAAMNDSLVLEGKAALICDQCPDSLVPDEISAAIDEAQGVKPDVQQLVREVIVTGIESRKNIVGWRYVTCRGVALMFTDLIVEFKGAKLYKYLGVPVAVCEALLVATSIGSFFAEQIERSYPCQKLYEVTTQKGFGN